MVKKSLALLLACIIVVSMFSGCSGTVSSSGGKDSSSGSKKIILSVFDCEAYGLDGYKTMVNEFEKENPGVTVNVQHAANNGDTILQTRFNSGDKPDVFAVEPGSSAQSYYEYAYDWSNDTSVLDKFKAGTVDLGKDSSGAVKALPWTFEDMGLIYNKGSFEKAGITTLPNNMDELTQDCVKLQAAGITPFSLDSKDTWALAQLATNFMMDKSLDAAGTVSAMGSGKLTFADMPHWNNFFKLLDLVKKYSMPKILEIDWEAGENDVASGKAAIIHMGDWAQQNFTSDNASAQLAFMPVPVGNSASDSTLLSSVGWVYIVNKDSKNLNMAKKFTEFILTSAYGQKWMTQSINAVPCCKTDLQPTGDLPRDAQNYINAGKTNGWIYTILPTDYADTCGAYIQAYLGGQSNASQVTKEFQDYFTSKK